MFFICFKPEKLTEKTTTAATMPNRTSEKKNKKQITNNERETRTHHTVEMEIANPSANEKKSDKPNAENDGKAEDTNTFYAHKKSRKRKKENYLYDKQLRN